MDMWQLRFESTSDEDRPRLQRSIIPVDQHLLIPCQRGDLGKRLVTRCVWKQANASSQKLQTCRTKPSYDNNLCASELHNCRIRNVMQPEVTMSLRKKIEGMKCRATGCRGHKPVGLLGCSAAESGEHFNLWTYACLYAVDKEATNGTPQPIQEKRISIL